MAEGYLPDYRRPDGFEFTEWAGTRFPTVDSLSLLLDGTLGLGHVVRIVSGDHLYLPDEYRDRKNPNQIEEIADLLARRFDPLYNLVKIEIHRQEQRAEIKRSARDTALAGGAAAVELATSEFGGFVGIALTCLMADRALIHGVRAGELGDKTGDEEKRIGPSWEDNLREQIIQAAQQAGIKEWTEKDFLIERTFEKVAIRHAAFFQQFGGDIETRKESSEKAQEEHRVRPGSLLDQAIHAGIEFHGLTKNRHGKLPLRPIRRMRAAEIENYIMTFVPEAERYLSLRALKIFAHSMRLRRR